ncbi:endopeptidase La [soil metagenome]
MKTLDPDNPGSESAVAVDADATDRQEGAHELPEDALIIVPVRNLVLFPNVVLPVAVGRKGSIAAAQEAARSGRKIGLLLQKDPETAAPGADDLYRTGTVASILRYVTTPDGNHHLICQGEQRFRALDYIEGFPFLLARRELLPDRAAETTEVEARLLYLQQQAKEAIRLLPGGPNELINTVDNIDSPSALADLVASFMDIKPAEKQAILETIDVRERLDKVVEFLNHRVEVLRLSHEIDQQTKEKMDERQREYLLREQLRTIQKELGEGDDRSAELEELREKIESAGMPQEAREQANKELKRLERMPEAAAEHSMVRTYLDWLIELPWSKLDEEAINIAHAREVLEKDHYGLEKIKRRILEYLAVRKLNPEGRSPILCFVGPPGVGKTSLGQSIARALGLEFVRASLGGVHDEAEIRGHRRTYIGSLPGNIVQNIRKAGTRNPVFMLDEMDKLGAGFHGDPSSALLEVLDPEQNSTFRDNYLAVPFDLSKVFFIGTANRLDTIPGPLRDRMEIIELPGYTEQEKVEIARRYLIERQLEANGLNPEQAELSDEALHALVEDYTREAGVRTLERTIGAVFRHIAMRVSEGETEKIRVDAGDLQSILGAPKFEGEVAMRTSVPGVATGLAWTPVGGDILFLETTRYPGKGKLTITGHLGDVMKESAQAALSLIKARADALGVSAATFEKNDLHLHVPAGAIPKDGPSAGVAMFVSMASLLTEQTVRSDTAMTGEISLRGLVLPVGGIKEKVLAAARADIERVLLPARNRKDYDDIPESAREGLEFVWLETVDDALAAAIDSRSESTGTMPPVE